MHRRGCRRPTSLQRPISSTASVQIYHSKRRCWLCHPRSRCPVRLELANKPTRRYRSRRVPPNKVLDPSNKFLVGWARELRSKHATVSSRGSASWNRDYLLGFGRNRSGKIPGEKLIRRSCWQRELFFFIVEISCKERTVAAN